MRIVEWKQLNNSSRIKSLLKRFKRKKKNGWDCLYFKRQHILVSECNSIMKRFLYNYVVRDNYFNCMGIVRCNWCRYSWIPYSTVIFLKRMGVRQLGRVSSVGRIPRLRDGYATWFLLSFMFTETLLLNQIAALIVFCLYILLMALI